MSQIPEMGGGGGVSEIRGYLDPRNGGVSEIRGYLFGGP